MLPIRKILCPTDFSEPAAEGFKNACLLAAHFGAELIVLNVTPPIPIMPMGHGAINFNVPEYREEMLNYAKSRLAELVAEASRKELSVTDWVIEGDAATEIVRAADDHHAGLIVIATHGHTGWRKFVTGSVTEKVVRTASCPVLTVQAPDKAE